MMRALPLCVVLGLLSCTDKDDTTETDTSVDTDDSDSDTSSETDTDTDTSTEACSNQTNVAPLGPTSCVNHAACSWEGGLAYERFGYRIAAGDVDGDGRADIIAGAPYYDAPGSAVVVDAGRVAIISGASLDASATGSVVSLYGVQPGGLLGYAVNASGDFNGDGALDLLIGSRGNSETYTNAGEVSLVLGPLTLASDGPLNADASWRGESEYARVGTVMDGAGDLNGDGLSDLVMTGELKQYQDDQENYRNGKVYVWYGRQTGWTVDDDIANADGSIDGLGSRDGAGKGLSSGGDLNGDGYPDLAVGAPYASNFKGRTYLFSGGVGALAGSRSVSTANTWVEGRNGWDNFGFEVVTGDWNQDGIDDLAVGAPLYDEGFRNAGAVLVYAGGTDLLSTAQPEPLVIIGGEFDDHEFGTGLLTRDLDGDGGEDLIAGAGSAWTGLITKGGRQYVIPADRAGQATYRRQVPASSCTVQP